MAVLLAQRLHLMDGTIIQQNSDPEAPTFEATTFGIVHVTDSDTGKRGGDTEIFPWHRVKEFRTWRFRA